VSRRRSGEVDPEQQRRQARANELMLAVAARLLGESRLAGAFPTEAGGLAPFVARLAPELVADEHLVLGEDGPPDLPRSDYVLSIDEPEPDELRLRCRYGSHLLSGRLRIDGVFDEGMFGVGIGGDAEQRIEVPPLEQEVLERAAAKRAAEGESGLALFRGERFLRAFAVPPQPGAAVQIVAVELFGDGLVVRYTYDDPVDVGPTVPFHLYAMAEVEPPIDELLAEAEAEGGTLEPDISVGDDVGTSYAFSGGGRGGVEVAHGEVYLTPAVPPAATRLIVSSYAGTVEVAL
jgi:hypothetical protein